MVQQFSRAVFLAAALSALWPLQLPGAEAPVTWEECAASAVASNPDIVSAREKLEQAASAAGVTRSVLLPQISANASGAHSSGTPSAGNAASNTYAYSIEGKQLIFDGLKSVYDYKASLAAVDSAKLDYAVVSAAVRSSLRAAFAGLLHAQRSLELAREIENVRARNYELVRVKYEAGSEHRGAFLTAKADHEQSLADIRSAERALSLAQRKLCSLMGKPEAPISVKGQLSASSLYDEQPSFQSLAREHPSVRKARIEREAALCELRSAQLSNSPDIYGTGSWGRQGETVSSMRSEWSVGIAASMPLFEGGASYYSMKKASAKLRQTESDERGALASTAVSIESAWNALRDSIADASVKSEYLKAETEREKIAEAQYSIGRMSFDDWTVIESGYVKAKQNLLTAEAALLTVEAAWIQSIGGTLEHDTQK